MITSEQHRRIIAMLHEGRPRKEIAETAGVTENTVVGIRHRAGGAAAFGQAPKQKRAVIDRGGGKFIKTNGHATVKGGGKALEALGPKDCRYPIGTPGEQGFHFCAKRRDGANSYCRHHRILCTMRAREYDEVRV